MVSIGSVVSHYRLERRLGAGGMGEVYLAQDTSLNRPVAIKFLIAPDDEQGRQRLLREARAVAALDHPAICAVYEVGTDPGAGDYIVMQYLEGESLGARLRRGPLPPDEALRIAGHIAEALRSAHRRGIVHRDLKPQNIIITTSGVPRLLDFGLARQLESSDVAAEALTVEPLTQPHAVIGTPGYMAPEQIRGRPADARSDVFALGCVLYECLTGRHAFTGSTSTDIHGQVLHVTPPPASSLNRELGEAHDALCARMMQKSAADRFQSAEEVLGAIRALAGARSSESGSAEAVPSGRRTRALTWLAVAVLVAAGVAAISYWNRGPGLPEPSKEALAWYARGVEALRQGSYAGAKAAMEEALRTDSQFVLAYCRLAEADAALDDQAAAQKALLSVSALVPNRNRLETDDRLRCDAAQAAVLPKRDQAIAAYRLLAEHHPSDAGAWLDLGRALEAADQRKEARANYEKSVRLDRGYAAGHLRLGVLQSTAGERTDAWVSFDEAIRLYRTAANLEGESESLLRKGVSKATGNQLREARELLEQAVAVADNPRYASQRIRARFELARVSLLEGNYDASEATAKQALDDAVAASLDTLAALGLIEQGIVYTQVRQLDRADASLARSIQLARSRSARRTEMRALLQQASVRLEMNKPQEALALADAPARFFDTGDERYLEGAVKNIQSRAHGDLENFAEATRLAKEALSLGEAIANQSIITDALEGLVGQLTSTGQFPEALAYRQRIGPIYAELGTVGRFPYDLASHADLLIKLGRGPEAEEKLAEIDRNLAAGTPAFKGRAPKLAQLRTFLAASRLQFAQAIGFARQVPQPEKNLNITAQMTRASAEFARASLGTSGLAPSAIAAWPQEAASPDSARELAYWCARTLAVRREAALAFTVADKALRTLPSSGNPELEWRLAAVAAAAKFSLHDSQSGASMRARAQGSLARLAGAWGSNIDRYLARPDLRALHEEIR